jgi:hypothetical protein
MLCEPYLPASEKDLRSPPKFLQAGGGRMHKLLFMPFAFFRFLSKIQILAHQYSNPLITHDGYGVFEEPKPEVLAAMTQADALKFQKEIAWLLWEAYDAEWWFILKERVIGRKKHSNWQGSPNVKKDLASFPTTEAGFHAWRASQLALPLLVQSTRFDNGTVELSDAGKYFRFLRSVLKNRK